MHNDAMRYLGYSCHGSQSSPAYAKSIRVGGEHAVAVWLTDYMCSMQLSGGVDVLS